MITVSGGASRFSGRSIPVAVNPAPIKAKKMKPTGTSSTARAPSCCAQMPTASAASRLAGTMVMARPLPKEPSECSGPPTFSAKAGEAHSTSARVNKTNLNMPETCIG